VSNRGYEAESNALKHNISLQQQVARVWGAVRKNIISDRFSIKTAISGHI